MRIGPPGELAASKVSGVEMVAGGSYAAETLGNLW